jgi:hypothetical protein
MCAPFDIEIPNLIIEAVSYASQSDDEASEAKESLVDMQMVIMTDQESAEAARPGKGALYFPAFAIAAGSYSWFLNAAITAST